jgi:2-polyprenyl-3-methyl-5-hydroxy-6-metoxy-1,4-benzoquinol methylase
LTTSACDAYNGVSAAEKGEKRVVGHLCVAIVGKHGSRWSETCRESVGRFTPEREDLFEVAQDAGIGSALSLARAPFVAFLDPRTAVSPGWAGRLVRALERSNAGAVGPLCNGAMGPQRRAADYQDIPGFLAFAEQIARVYDGQVQAVERLDPCCLIYRRELLGSLDPETRLVDLPQAIRAAGAPLILALDVYVHTFADYFFQERSELVRLIPPGVRRVLDVGCGAGALGAALKRQGLIEVVGVERDPGAAEVARAVLDRVYQNDIEVLDLPNGAGTFDCIVLADVLEHLRDPWGVLRRLAPLLGAHGRLIVSLPNVRHWSVLRGLLSGEWTYLPAGILDRGHLRFFTLKGGRALLEEAGLAILEVHPVRSGSAPDLTPLIDVAELLAIDCSTLAEEAQVTQYLFVAEKRG